MRSARLLAALLVTLAACSGSDEAAAPSTTAAGTATSDAAADETDISVPDFTGDPDSPFCTLVAGAGDRPVLDPFEAGLEPDEVELRMRALRLRFTEFADVAPPDLAGELEDVVTALDGLDAALDAAGYDFAALAESGTDLSTFDAPQFAETAARVDAYRTQVCRR